MKAVFTFLLVFSFQVLVGQMPCEPYGPNSIPPGDEPPGCFMCIPSFSGTNAGATPDTTDYQACFTVENSLWFSYRPHRSNRLIIAFLASDCQTGKGLEIAVYDEDLNCIDYFSQENATSGNINFPAWSTEETYLIQIDGYEGDVCDFTLIVSGGRSISDGPPDPPKFNITPDKYFYCIGEEICFEALVFSANRYEWKIPSFASLTSGGELGDKEVCIKLDSVGMEDLDVATSNECYAVFPFSKRIIAGDENIGTIDSIIEPSVPICPISEFEYHVESSDANVFDWQFPSFLQLIDGGKGENFARFSVYGFDGMDSIIVTPQNCFGDKGEPVSVPFEVAQGSKINRIPFYYCEDEYPDFPIDTCYSINSPCDSCIIYNIVPLAPTTVMFDTTICENDCVVIGDSCYAKNVTLEYPNADVNGCDSIVHWDINLRRVHVIDTTICENDCVVIGDSCYSKDVIFKYLNADINGCDSTVHWNINPRGVQVIDTTICREDCVVIGDSCYAENVLVNLENANSNGCDSMIQLNIQYIRQIQTISCAPNQIGPSVIWTFIPSADYYIVNINGMVDTLFDNVIQFENLLVDTILNISVTPIGNCHYDTFMDSCLLMTTSTSDFISENLIQIYPNPTTDQLLIETDLHLEFVELYDITGNFFGKLLINEIDLTNFKSGVYFLKIYTEEGVAIKKFIKN